MPDDFNPYHQWLGLGKQVSSPAPHQLLGVAPGETDVAKIQQAADQAASRVRSQAPGPRAADWTRLLAEIEAAKKSLIAQATGRSQPGRPIRTVPMGPAGTYRPAPRSKSAPASPSYPVHDPTTASGTGPPVGYPPPVGPSAGLPVATPVTGSSAPARGPAPRTRIAVKTRRARRTRNLVAFAWTAGALMVVAAVFLPLAVILKTREKTRSNSVATVAPSIVEPSSTPAATPVSPSSPKPADSKDQEPDLPLEPTEDQPMPDKEILDTAAPTAPPTDLDLPSFPPTPAPANGRGTPTPQQIEQLSRVLVAARTALEHDRFEEALTRLADIQNLPMLADDARRYQRLQLLVQYARHFHEELASAVAELQGGDEIPVGTSAAVGVVQTGPEQITVRVAGANRTYHLDALPTGLAIAIVDLRLADSDPISLVVKAAYLVSRADARDDQLQKARDWFREAKEKGADIGDLEQVLDDTYPPSP